MVEAEETVVTEETMEPVEIVETVEAVETVESVENSGDSLLRDNRLMDRSLFVLA